MRGERYVNPVLFWLADGYRLQAQNEDGRSKCGHACVATMERTGGLAMPLATGEVFFAAHGSTTSERRCRP